MGEQEATPMPTHQTHSNDSVPAATMAEVSATVFAAATGVEPPERATSVLSFIEAHQRADAEWRQSIEERIHAEARAEALCLRNAVLAALDRVERLGTTRGYERCLNAIEAALDESRFGEVHDWYVREVAKAFADGHVAVRVDHIVHPKHRLLTRWQ